MKYPQHPQRENFIKLLKEGKNQKRAAAHCGISIKTACKWAKARQGVKIWAAYLATVKRLTAAANNPETTPEQLARVADAVIKIQAAAIKATNEGH